MVEWSSGNGHRIREAKRVVRNSEVEEVGDEVQSLEKHKQNGPYQRQCKGQKAKGKIKVETLTTCSFPLHNSQH